MCTNVCKYTVNVAKYVYKIDQMSKNWLLLHICQIVSLLYKVTKFFHVMMNSLGDTALDSWKSNKFGLYRQQYCTGT